MSSRRRRPIFTTRLTRARNVAARVLARPLNWFRPTTQFVIAFTVLSIATTFLLSHTHTQAPMEMYREGDVVRTSVIAPADIGYEDPQLTEAARATNPSASPVTGWLHRNQVVAREGDTVTTKMLAQIEAIRSYSHHERRPEHYLGLLFLVAALYWGVWKFVDHRSLDKALPLSKGKTYTLLTSAILIETLLMRVGVIVAKSISVQYERAPWNDATILSFAIPFAAATLLVALLMDVQLALITAIVTAIFAGILAPNGVMMACYAMISSSAAIFGVGRYRERQSVTVAGLYVAIVSALAAIAVIFAAQQPLTVGSLLLAFGCGVAGGVLTTIFTAGGLPVNEAVFGVLTDVKLLELSNADLPVLGQLALRAPGTNQHSHAVGQLAEEACRAIGANALLARIGALYHDIGKLAAPDMFVENQTGDNPHDRLRPSNSARIITSHVTYGMRLAREIGLPKKIADFIPQHHGTRTLHFFLRKAQAQAIHGEQVNESEFRYPGPKPQFKESAIMMLADSCEAAARSLARPDPQNIRTICNKIFEAIVSDGQLDECDLSLRELTAIRESIIASLTAIYHARIDYPGFNPPALSNSMSAVLPAAELDTEERGVHYNKPSEVPISKGGEVEDEAVTSEDRR
jgi:cyclic-di-AMP phosphodiesterase PgpH